MRFQCPECQRIIAVDDELCGHDVECADCSGIAGVMTTIHVPDDRLAPGGVLNDFVLEERLHESETELTFSASQVSLGRPVVVKVLKPELMEYDDAQTAFIEKIREIAHKPGAQPCEPLALGEEDGYLYQVYKAHVTNAELNALTSD